jgi:hypothetical protein
VGHNFAKSLRQAQAVTKRFQQTLAALAVSRLERLRHEKVGDNLLTQPNLVNQTAEPPRPRPPFVIHDVQAARSAEALGRMPLKARKKLLAAKRRARR